MESTDVSKMMDVVRQLKVCKPYVAPKLRRLSPALVKSLLSLDFDRSNNELQQLMESVDQLHRAKGA
jgi:hypothetical protein